MDCGQEEFLQNIYEEKMEGVVPKVVVTDYQGKSFLLEEGLDDPPSYWFYKNAPNLFYRNRFVEAMGNEKWSSTKATTFALQPFDLDFTR